MKHLMYCGMLIVQYLVLFVDVNIADGVPTTNNVIARQCMQDGGYQYKWCYTTTYIKRENCNAFITYGRHGILKCQNSWDCCSNRCLSFSYKCVKGPPTSAYQPYAPSIIEDPTLISVDTLEDLVNRFGSDDEKTLPKPTTTSPVSSTSTSTSSSTIHTDAQCIGIGYECGDSSQCCSNECLHYLDVHICIEKRIPTTAATTTVSPNGQCLLIGQKCYSHDECCTKRCHGFLHQCVT